MTELPKKSLTQLRTGRAIQVIQLLAMAIAIINVILFLYQPHSTMCHKRKPRCRYLNDKVQFQILWFRTVHSLAPKASCVPDFEDVDRSANELLCGVKTIEGANWLFGGGEATGLQSLDGKNEQYSVRSLGLFTVFFDSL